MRFTRLTIGPLALLLLIAVPVNAAPALHTGSQTDYNLSVTISFVQSCGPVLGSALSPDIVCPMSALFPPSLNITGTLGWALTDLNATTATLNVTRDVTPSGGDLPAPAMRHAGSSNESINLATRIASILPFIEPEMDKALWAAQASMATSLPAGTSWSSTVSSIDDTMMRQPLHTMWWVNGPLKQNDSVPVLLFETNVTGSTNVGLGSPIGSRTAWTLTFNRTRSLLPPSPLASTTSSIPTVDNFEFALTFNYDQTSDLLLSANADIHLGFGFIQPMPCNSTATPDPALTICPATSVPVMREFGIDVQASLRLASTTLDLGQRLTPTGGSGSSSGSSSGSGSGTGSGSGIGSGSGSGTGTGSGQGSGAGSGTGSSSGSGSGSGSGYSPGSGSTTTGAGQPASNPAQSKPTTKSAGLFPWIYGILGVIAAAIVASGVWIARRRMKRPLAQVPNVQGSA